MSQSLFNLSIGIVGAGNIGETLATHFTRVGHRVKISNSRGPETLTAVAQRSGATPTTVTDALKNTSLIIVTIPQKAILALDRTLFTQLPADTIIIDTGNWYKGRDGNITELDTDTMSESEWVATHIGRPVIKCFNNIYYRSLAANHKPAGTVNRIALPVAGDSGAHKATVIALLDQIGFDGVDAGSIAESWRQQPGTPVYGCDWDAEQLKAALRRADRNRSREVSKLQMAVFGKTMAPDQPVDAPAIASRQLMSEQYGL